MMERMTSFGSIVKLRVDYDEPPRLSRYILIALSSRSTYNSIPFPD